MRTISSRRRKTSRKITRISPRTRRRITTILKSTKRTTERT